MKKPSPYRDPGAEQRYMEAESKIRKIEQGGKKKKATKPKKSPCGTGSLTGSTYK